MAKALGIDCENDIDYFIIKIDNSGVLPFRLKCLKCQVLLENYLFHLQGINSYLTLWHALSIFKEKRLI